MKKHLCRIAIVLILAATLGPIIMSTGCSQPNHEGFAIYSTKENISPDKISDLNQITIAGKPIIGLDDIVSYNQTNHAITLTKNAFMRIIDPDLPAWGNTFVVCVDRKPIYWGAVLTMASSVIYDGVTIIAPLPVSQEISPITIGLGYPDPDYFKGEDPRNNVVIMDSLRQAGKLIGEGFAIYLTKDALTAENMPALTDITIAETPLIALNDVVTYSSAMHQLTLTADAYNRISELHLFDTYTTFVVCVDKSPVYWGTFWPGFSSAIPYHPTISNDINIAPKDNTITIEQGFPLPSAPDTKDHRNDLAILDSLKQAGKLINEGFAIYLTKDDILPSAIKSLSQAVLADKPLITPDDIVSYNTTYYGITLTPDAFARITSLHVATTGKSFVVCVDGNPIYWGAFWTPVSSQPFSGVIIMKPLSSQDTKTITIGLGYPSPSYFKGTDPRNDAKIIDSLTQTGKIISEGFAIYLTKANVPPSQMEALSHVDIADTPVIKQDDIVAYNILNHEITLTDDAFTRLSKLQVPTSGKSFVVCVDRNPLYWGAFWTPISSQSFSGVIIEIPLSTQTTKTITIELAYPSDSFFKGEDPRNNQTVLSALQQRTTLLGLTLPESFKGYELYSWQQDNQWNFTLITGTNRNKTTDEIIAQVKSVTIDGWVDIHVVGINAIKDILSRLQGHEFIVWQTGPSSAQVTFAFPPADIVDEIRNYVMQCGLSITILR